MDAKEEYSIGRVGKTIIKIKDKQRIILINGVVFQCTKIEYQILMLLLKQIPVTDFALIHEVLHCAVDPSTLQNVHKHVGKLREKMRGTGLGIPRVHGYGYLLAEEGTEA